jgi:hypothetical protein
MSSGWLRDSDLVAPLPFGWKLCLSVVPKTICLKVSVPLGVVALVLAVGEPEPELELGPELEHPAIPNRPAATTVMLMQVTVRRLNIFTAEFSRRSE